MTAKTWPPWWRFSARWRSRMASVPSFSVTVWMPARGFLVDEGGSGAIERWDLPLSWVRSELVTKYRHASLQRILNLMVLVFVVTRKRLVPPTYRTRGPLRSRPDGFGPNAPGEAGTADSLRVAACTPPSWVVQVATVRSALEAIDTGVTVPLAP